MTSPLEASAIRFSEVSCSRNGADGVSQERLRDASAEFPAGTFTILAGAESGGRDLCLRLTSLLETPDAGEIWLEGQPTRELNDAARAELRGRRLGLVFAAPFLLPSFTAIENIAMPLFKHGQTDIEEARRRAETALDFVGLGGWEETPAEELSPYDQRCVALARALAAQPAALIAENVDLRLNETAHRAFPALLRRAAEHFQLAIIGAAEATFEAQPGDRLLRVEDGRLEKAAPLLPESTS